MGKQISLVMVFGLGVWAAQVLEDCAAQTPTAEQAVSLPAGVKVVWDSDKAYRETTPTRERVCLNGLWRWQPAEAQTEQVPATAWGYFKVPACWPGIGNYLQKDCQNLYAHPQWPAFKPGTVTAAWYERQIAIPANWKSRQITMSVEYLNSYAAVFVEGQKVGVIRFPGGELDLTGTCRPGNNYRVSLLVVAMPLKGVMLSYTDSASAREVKGTVERRGLCGDVFLVSAPRGPRITDVRAAPSLRQQQCTFDTALEGLAPNTQYTLRARLSQPDGAMLKEFVSSAFRANNLKEGRLAFTEKWRPDQLWDLNTPQNIFHLQLSLLDAGWQVLDTSWTVPLGFREFWIQGRDFYLNGTRIFLSAVPLDNAQVSAASATYSATKETLERLKSFGINYVYTHNYGCQPGSHLGFAEILRAADDVGMLVGFSQPHFSHYDWQGPDADRANGYARHAEFYVRAAQHHPSVVMYSMSHNATGYEEDMNPDMIDGLRDVRESWAQRNSRLALRAEAIVQHFDPDRIVYHHASGNLGSMHDINFYPNFVPIQELSDWYEHWATQGVKPAFMCEYGAPFTWDWTMYRGWYKGQREFGSARVPWEFCLAEWNAQFLGDRAYAISEAEKANLRWEARQFRAGNLWRRWDYPNEVGSSRFTERYPVFAMYLTDNWRAFRTWGVSGISPWEYEHFWRLREGVDKRPQHFQVDWEHLQRPGFSPDFVDRPYERMDMAYQRNDWIPTAAAEALLRNNQPLLAYIAGKPQRSTSKDHNYLPGDTVEKQIVVINNSRTTVKVIWQAALDLGNSRLQNLASSRPSALPTGQQERIPLRFVLPTTLAHGRYHLRASASFSTGETQADDFLVDVLPRPTSLHLEARIALFDPKGETGAMFSRLGIPNQPVAADADLSGYDLLIVGKSALTLDGPAPDISRVREGLKVLLFEQTSTVLEKRFGFRIEEYGLRQVFPRISDHPVLAGLSTENLHDWRGAATILPPRLTYESRPRFGPTVQWCGLPVTRLWRCGNQGNVASVLIEKPTRGDFLPLLDGGFSLQYSPLLEYHEGRGLILFCQMDVTGRTEADPAAETLASNLLRYAVNWTPRPHYQAVYAGDPVGQTHLASVGVSAASFNGASLSSNQVLIVGPGGSDALANHATAVVEWVKAGGRVLAIGLDQQQAETFLPFKVTFKKGEHIAAFFESPGKESPLAGVGPSDVHNRDPRELPLIAAGAQILGDGVLAQATDANVVFCQLVPWQFDWTKQANLKKTCRRAAFLVSRLLANLGVEGSTQMLNFFHRPTGSSEKRWLAGLYVDQPEEWDDPYRHFRW